MCRGTILALLLTIALGNIVTSAGAQVFITNYQQYRMRDGLPSDRVTSLYEDVHGFLWIGTNAGLARFDGTVFQVFPMGPGSVPALYVSRLYRLNDSVLYVGTHSGIAAYNLRADSFENHRVADGRLRAGSGAVVMDMVKLKGHRTLVAADKSLYVLDRDGRVLRERKMVEDLDVVINLHSPPVFTTADSGRMLVYSKKGGLHELDLATLVAQPTNGRFGEEPFNNRDPMMSAARVGSGNRFLYSTYWGDYRFRNLDSGIAIDYATLSSKPPGASGKANRHVIDPGDSTTMWIASEFGLRRFSTSSHLLTTYVLSTVNTDFLPTNSFNDMAIDRHGQIWLASTAGLVKISRLTWELHDAGLEAQPNYAKMFFTGALAGPDGTVWYHTYGQGIHAQDSKGNVSRIATDNTLKPGPEIVFDMTVANGEVYAGTNHGVHRYNQRSRVFEPTGLVPDSIVRDRLITALHRDSRDEWWIGVGGGGGLVRVHADGSKTIYDHYRHAPGSPLHLPIRYPLAIAEDRSGNLWMGLARVEGMIIKWNRAAETFDTAVVTLGDEKLVSVAATYMVVEGNDLWVCTYGHGVLKHDLVNGGWQRYGIRSGLRSLDVSSLSFDADGNVWVSTHAGIAVLTRGTERFKSFGMQDGLPFDRVGWLGFPYPDHPDRLLIMGQGYAVWVNKDALVSTPVPLRVSLKHVAVDNDTISLVQTRFRYNQSHFVFHYAAVNLVSGPDNRYAYMLEGLDKTWVDAGAARYANYANVPPGRYSFIVKARNADGAWSEPASFSFVITAPYWQRWWFYVLVAMLLTGVVYAAYRIRINRILEMERVRSRISRDLHDDIGSTLSSINIIAHSVKRRLAQHEYEKAVGSLEKISDRTQRTLDNMSDIIWSIKPQNDSLGSILWRMREHASTVFEARGIHYKIDFPPEIDNIRLPLELKNNLFLVFKEAINNLAKYSSCTHATVCLTLEKRTLHLTVQDNGVGFPVNENNSGNGMLNMKRRAEESNAQLIITSSPGHGTTVEFVKKLP